MVRVQAYIALLALLLASFPAQASADIYKYVDEEGGIHFSNVPVDSKADRVVSEKAQTRTGSGPVYTPASKLKAEYASYTPGKSEPLDDDVPYSEIINTKCDKYGVSTSLVKAIIKAESNFNPRAVSNKGAVGLMQLMPATASYMDVRDSYDPEQNIDGGVRYVRYLLDNFGGDVELTVAAYNCGEGRVVRNGNCVPDIKETKNYVKKVMKLSDNPVTGKKFSKSIYKIELEDGSIMFTESPAGFGTASLVD